MPSLQFKGKVFVQNHHLVVPYHELTPVKAKGLSKTASLHDNLIIEGDNLAALKALLPAYHGKVKCIYIDPPYNTGNEKWVYNDNVNSPMMQDWLGKVVDREDLTRHDKWCCMMMPRLKLLRELLRDDGAIFVSIDEKEVHRLRCLMDEVFGEENFIGDISVVNNLKGRSDDQYIATAHEHLLFYRRSEKFKTYGWPLPEEYQDEYTERDEDGEFYRLQGLRKRGAGARRQDREDMFYPFFFDENTCALSLIRTSATEIEIFPRLSSGDDGRWRWGKTTAQKRILELVARKVEGRDEFDVFQKDFLFLGGDLKKIKPKSTWLNSSYSTDTGTRIYKQVMGKLVFPNPKSPYLIEDIIRQCAKNDEIVLDSFAGSGTTAQAVLALNAEDGGKRRFVLCQIPYETKEQERNSENICETITARRVQRVIRGVPKAKDENLRKGFGGTFSYFKLGKALRLRAILEGSALPDYESLASYVFFTATGEEFNAKKIDKKTWFIGESRNHDVFLLYEPDAEKLKQLALTLDVARALPSVSAKPKLVFAPTKYLDPYFLDSLRITFQQLPYQIYKALET